MTTQKRASQITAVQPGIARGLVCSILTIVLLILAFAVPAPILAQGPSMQTPAAPQNGDGSGSPPPIGAGGPTSSYFYSLSFSTAPDGPDFSNFPAGTPQVYVRFNYVNVPLGTTLSRQWYRNGQPYLSRNDAWNPAWGSNGRLGGISIYDFQDGLPSGTYDVVISLIGYPDSVISGRFTIDGAVYPTSVYNPMAFSGLTTSTSPAGPDVTYFGAGTQAVYIRFNYSNIPIGTVVRREWYKDNALFRVAQDVWSSYWGPTGRLTHISLYDYINGLPAGNWRVAVFLVSYPTVRADVNFVIAAGQTGSPYFANLTFSTSINGPSYGAFYAYTRQIFARWNYANAPVGATMLRRWYRNSVLWLERREPWYRSGAGTVYTSIFDFQTGLQPGNYYVEISLEGVPNSTVTGYFRVG
jgi:hypothetical protein